jgi:hypothetical protein
MARFLVLWRVNWKAPWPTDPSKYLELNEKMWAGIDGLMKNGQIEEFGTFPDGESGYTIGKGETADLFASVMAFHPYIRAEVHEIIPYETQKAATRAILEARIAEMRK